MSLRRVAVALAVLTTGALGAGFATSASATPPCDQAPQACQVYDSANRTTVAFFTVLNSFCTDNVEGGKLCPVVQAGTGLVYKWVFFPYDVCYNNVPNVGSGCVGPIE